MSADLEALRRLEAWLDEHGQLTYAERVEAAADEIERLRRERDEGAQAVCRWDGSTTTRQRLAGLEEHKRREYRVYRGDGIMFSIDTGEWRAEQFAAHWAQYGDRVELWTGTFVCSPTEWVKDDDFDPGSIIG